MRYRSGSWIVLMALLWVADATAAKPNPEEFAVPLQAAPTVLRSTPPGSVRLRPVKDELTGQPALRAGTAQAAIAAAVGQRAAGCRMIRFGASFGWVATGVATYPASDNPVALNRSRQEARFKAFTDAGARLAGCWSGLSPEARRRIAESLEQSDAIRLALINLAFTEADKQEQALRILARGYVAYSVEHDAGQRAIYVNLVTTPKTAARLTRPAPDAVEAVSLQEGLRQAHAEIAAGLIPPAGNRLIEVNATGELALVGYAANLIGAHRTRRRRTSCGSTPKKSPRAAPLTRSSAWLRATPHGKRVWTRPAGAISWRSAAATRRASPACCGSGKSATWR